MKKINLIDYARKFANIGHDAQNVASLTLTGVAMLPDNKPFSAGGDIGNIQIKGYRATVCKGDDLEAHLALDGATTYGYVTSDLKTLYLMSRDEYRQFVNALSRVEKNSKGELTIRLKHESEEFKMWLRKHTA